MTKPSKGGAVSRAPHWRPDKAGLVADASTRRAQADGLTRAALGTDHPKSRDDARPPQPALAGAALNARGEARIAGIVAGYTSPCLDPSGPLPFAPGRGPLDHVTVHGFVYDAKVDGDVVADRPVRMRRGPSALASMPSALRAAAGRYAALVEAVASPGCRDPQAPRGGGISDGGATSRCGMAEALRRRAVPAIGYAVVLRPRGLAAHADRPRYVLAVRELVDRVCLNGWTVDKVLAWRGWSRRQAYRNACRDALGEALARLAQVI